jgi:serine/threonine protein kinase
VVDSTNQQAGGSSVKPVRAHAGDIKFLRYKVKKLIGVGGMAEVFLAEAEQPDGERVPVVIKRIKREHAKDSRFVRMFLDEAKLAANMSHPNIVEVYEYGDSGGVHYLSMEHIDGVHLQELHRRHEKRHGGPLPWQVVSLIIRDVLRGLDYAHKLTDEEGELLGLIHRDVNLDNVMIDRQGKVKLLDFGIVKAREGLRAAETAAGVLKGKFGYMSPEQVAGKTLAPSSDVFSASVCFHELLTGRRLFWGDDDIAILMAVKEKPIPNPRKQDPAIPEDIVRILLEGLERDPAARFSSAAEMADELDRAISKHRVDESQLRSVASGLIRPPRKLTDEEKLSQRKKTLLAWSEGAAERAEGKDDRSVPSQPAGGDGPRATSGTLGAVGGDGETLASPRSSTTDPRWGEPTGRAGGAEAGPDLKSLAELGQATVEEQVDLPGEKTVTDAQPPPELSEQKTVMLDSESSSGRPDPALSEQKTVMLDSETRSDRPGPALSEQKTVMLDSESSADTSSGELGSARARTEAGVDESFSDENGSDENGSDENGSDQEAGQRPDAKEKESRKRAYVLVAAVGALIVTAAILLLLGVL